MIKCAVFAVAGALTGLAALLNSVRFNQIPSNAGHRARDEGDCRGGRRRRGDPRRRRATLAGTLLGVVLLGAIGPALTFLGVSAYWERALQGAIILAAVAIDAVRERGALHAARRARRSPA